MAKKLNPDGVPVEIPSIQRKSVSSLFAGIDQGPGQEPNKGGSGDDPTMVEADAERHSKFPDEPPTRPGGLPPRSSPVAVMPESDEPRTQIAGGFRRHLSEQHPSSSAASQGSQQVGSEEDPVVGWLVVVKGPGRGFSIRLGMGQNSIGRGAASRVRINFGDDQISRSNHASITYDPQGNRFHVHPGTGLNLTYMDDEPVLRPTPLADRSRITIGGTTLCFVALCGNTFSWKDRGRAKETNPRVD